MKKNKSPFQDILQNTKRRLSDFQNKIKKMKKTPTTQREKSTFPSAEPKKKECVEISTTSVAKSTMVVLLLLLLFYFLYQISGILVIFFVSFLLAAALDPIIDSLQRLKIPRPLGVLLIYFLVFVSVGLLISNLAPLIAGQIGEIANNISQIIQSITVDGDSTFPFAKYLRPYLNQIYQAIDINTAATQIQSALNLIASQLLNISFGLMNVVLVLILTFFMTIEEKAMEQFYLSLFPSRYGTYISTRLEAIKEKIGYWLRGQLLLCVIAAVLSYIGLRILNVEYALTLSVLSGMMMVIPVLGRIFALILTLPIVLSQSPLLALWVSIYYIILQQIELNIISSFVMNRAVGLSPIIIIFAMLVGSQYLGILGLIISVPIATCVAIFVKDYMEKAK